MKGFTQLSKKGVPLHWDHSTQKYFVTLKDVLARASLLYPLTINDTISSI